MIVQSNHRVILMNRQGKTASRSAVNGSGRRWEGSVANSRGSYAAIVRRKMGGVVHPRKGCNLTGKRLPLIGITSNHNNERKIVVGMVRGAANAGLRIGCGDTENTGGSPPFVLEVTAGRVFRRVLAGGGWVHSHPRVPRSSSADHFMEPRALLAWIQNGRECRAGNHPLFCGSALQRATWASRYGAVDVESPSGNGSDLGASERLSTYTLSGGGQVFGGETSIVMLCTKDIKSIRGGKAAGPAHTF
jgi:hypothetical protein